MIGRNTIEKQVALFALNDINTFIQFLKFLEEEDIKNPVYREIYKLQKEHYVSKQTLHDRKFLLDYIEEKIKENEDWDIGCLEKIKTEQPAFDSKNHILTDCLKYAKKSRLYKALSKSAEELDKEDFQVEKSLEFVSEAVSVNYDTDLGMSVFQFRERIAGLNKIMQDAIPSFSPVLNEKSSGGRFPGELYVYMAPPGVGKSLFLVQDGYHAMIKGYKVVHITCELNRLRVGLRYDNLHARMTTKEIFSNLQSIETRYKTLRTATKGDIIIKEYPPNTATVLDISIFLDQLKIYDNYIPDVLIVDYGDILKPIKSRDKEYSEQGEIFVGLRTLAVERNIPVITATQSTREMLNKIVQKVSMAQVSDSFHIPRIADAMYALAQTERERELGIINLKIVKNRNGPAGHSLPFQIDYAKMRAVDTEIENNQ
jgi:replicative DNA helicase